MHDREPTSSSTLLEGLLCGGALLLALLAGVGALLLSCDILQQQVALTMVVAPM